MGRKVLFFAAAAVLFLTGPASVPSQQEVEMPPPGGGFGQPGTVPPGELEAVPAGPPDLSIARLRAVPKQPQLGGRVSLEALVRNGGSVDLDGIVVRFFTGGGAVGDGEIRFLRAGASGMAKVSIEAAPEGRREFRAVVDPDNGIHESNERNNEARGEFTVQPPLGRGGAGKRGAPEDDPPHGEREREPAFGGRRGDAPVETDLMVRSLTVKGERVILGRPVPVEAVIVNGGPGKADRVKVRIIAGEEHVGGDQHTNLSPRARSTVHGTWRPKRTGHHAVAVIVDPEGALPDSDRRNNIREVVVEVFPGDEIERDPGRPVFGGALKKIVPPPGKADRVRSGEGLKKLPSLPPPPSWETHADSGPTIVVTSPVKTSVWPQGSSQVITWAILTGKAGPTFTLKFLDPVKAYPIATKATFTTNSHLWTVPSMIPDGTYRVSVEDGKDGSITGTSAYFKVGKVPPKIIESEMIDVWSPSAGKTYPSGGTVPVRWYSLGLDPKKDKVKVVIYPDGKPHLIGKATPPPLIVIGGGEPEHNPATVISSIALDGLMDNTGTLDWKVPSNYPSGAFRVRVQNKSASASDDSEVFNLTTKGPSLPHRAPSWLGRDITITSPVAGDSWKPGTHKATWKCATYDACKNKSFKVTLLSRHGDLKVSSATAIGTAGTAALAVYSDTPPGEYIVRIETMDQKAQIDSGVFDVVNPKEPTNASFSIADAKWKFSSSKTGKLVQIQVLVSYKSDTDFFIGDYGDPKFGSQSVQLQVTAPQKLGLIVPQGKPFPKPYQSWLESKVLLKETHSVTGDGGSMAMSYPKTQMPKGAGSYVLTFQPKSPYVIRSLFWIFKECSAGFDTGPFAPGCLCHGTHAPKLSAVLTVHTKNTTNKDSKTFYLGDAPTKVQKIDHDITDIDCPNPKW